MIRVMVVEDEAPILRNLCNMIEKTNNTFSIEYRAQNGEDALEIIRDSFHSIELLFLDIHMPLMDGVTLLKKLKELNIFIPTIVLSGYQDFHYVREALRYGVIEYLLKPINQEALAEVLIKAEDKILEDAYRKSGAEQGDGEQKDYEVALVRFGSEYLSREKRCVGRVYPIEDLKELQRFSSYLNSKLDSNEYWLIVDKFEPEIYIIFKKKDGKIRRILNEYIKNREVQQLEVTILLSDELQSRNSIYSKRLQLGEQIKCIIQLGANGFYYGNTDIIYEENIQHIENLRKEIQSANVASEMKNKINDTLSKAINRRQVITGLLLAAFSYYSSRFTLNYSYELILEELYQIIEESDKQSLLVERINELLLRSYENVDPSDKKKKVAWEIKAYIEKKYMEPISNRDIAKQFGFVEDYMRSIFSREFGMTPMEFMQRIRIEKTKIILLNNKTIPFKDIASQVGYHDASYYSKIFKKSEGLTPSEYRKKYES